MSTSTFVVVWDNLGLEYVGNVTEDEQRRVWGKLNGKPVPSQLPNVNHLLLRARYNSQRHYEIYLVNATDGITTDDIRAMFEASPQTAADTIRTLGHCYYSDRVNKDKILIT
jgi:hypothetical protein